MKGTGKLLTSMAVAVAIAGCASTPRNIDELQQAHAVVQRVESLPDAGKYAAEEVEAAHEALRNADRMLDKDRPAEDVRDAAYLAQRHAQIAEQQIARGRAQEATESAKAERERVLLQARQAEAAAREREAAARELQARVARNQALDAAESARGRAAQLEEELADLKARETERGIVLTLGDVLFDNGKASLKPGARSSIERLVEFLEEQPRRSVTIEGHTDSMGSETYNQALSEDRAQAVENALVQRGIDAGRVDTAGMGESSPVATNDTAAGRQQNRRVEIIISKQSEVAGGPVG